MCFVVTVIIVSSVLGTVVACVSLCLLLLYLVCSGLLWHVFLCCCYYCILCVRNRCGMCFFVPVIIVSGVLGTVVACVSL